MAASFKINQFTRSHDDDCGVDSYYKQSVGPGAYLLTNLTPKPNDVQPIAHASPTVMAKEGYGTNVQRINDDSQLRNHKEQTSGQRCPMHPQSRPFLTVPFMGRGRGNAELESKLQQSEFIRTGKDCGTVTDKPFEGVFTPLLPHIAANIQDPKHIVPESAASGWVRGGIPSRQYVRDINC